MTSVFLLVSLFLPTPTHADSTGEQFQTGQYERMGSFVEGLAPVGINGKWGFVDSSGTLVIPAIYDDWNYFSKGEAYVSRHGLWGKINRNGVRVQKQRLVQFSMSTRTAPSIVPFTVGEKVGYRSLKGEEISPPIFEDGGPIQEGLAQIKKDSLWGFMDGKGNIIIKPEYDMARSFSEGLAAVLKDEKWGFIDTKGKLVVPNEFDLAKSFREGLAPVRKGFKWGYVDRTGRLIIPPEFIDAFNFSHGTAMVQITEPAPAGVKLSPVMFNAQIDRSGKVQYRYSAGGAYGDIHVISSSDGKYGLLSSQTGLILKPRYDEILGAGAEGYFIFKDKARYGYLDISGDVAIKPVFEEAGLFDCGIARVRTNGKYGLINSSGIFIVPAEYDSLTRISSKIFKATRGEEAGEVDILAGELNPKSIFRPAIKEPGIVQQSADTEEYISKSSAEINAIIKSFSDVDTCSDLTSSTTYHGFRPIISACGLAELIERSMNGKCFVCYLALAEYYSEWGSSQFDYRGAVENAGKAIAINPSDPRPYKIRAAIGIKYEDESYYEHFSQAIGDYLKLVELDKSDISRKSDACRAGAKSPGLLGTEKLATIHKLCDEVLSTAREDWETLIARSAILAASGNNLAAIADLDAALKINKNNPAALLAKAHAYENLKDWRRAAFYYTKTIDNTSGYISSEINESRGKCYLHLRYCEKAKLDFESAAKKLDSVTNRHYMAAYYWTCEKNTAKTLTYIGKLLDWGEQCEGPCYRPGEYKEFLSGLDDNSDYTTLLEKYKGKY